MPYSGGSAHVNKRDLLNLEYTYPEIEQRTKAIYCRSLAESSNLCEGNFTRIAVDDLRFLFERYDAYFFSGFFKDHCQGKVRFRLSRRMTKAAGAIAYRRDKKLYTISLSSVLIFGAFRDGVPRVVVNGIACRDRLEATMRVLEHEIIHLLEFLSFGRSSCSRPRFRRLSRDIFGHADVTHQLVPRREETREGVSLRVGDEVAFEYKGRTHRGRVRRITKRATVMVNDSAGAYVDSRGGRYSKYYVPLYRIQRPGDQHERP